MINVAILTISDSSNAGTRADLSGPSVAARCREQGWLVTNTEVIPDDRHLISARISSLADDMGADVILTTGGTGVSSRDITPEATRDVIHKEIPGLGELMRTEGLRHTRRAALSRGIAGTRDRTLVVNLPGSPKGAVQSLNAILDLVPHLVDLLHGRTAHPEELNRPNEAPKRV